MAFGHFAERRAHHPALRMNALVDSRPPADNTLQVIDEDEKKEAVVNGIKAKILAHLKEYKGNIAMKGLAHTLYGSIDGDPNTEPSDEFYLAIHQLLQSKEIVSTGGDLVSLGTVHDHTGKGKTVGPRISRHIAARN